VYAVARYSKELAALSGSEAIGFLSTSFPGRGYKERMYDRPVRIGSQMYDRPVCIGSQIIEYIAYDL
jgi:hypothetical protein